MTLPLCLPIPKHLLEGHHGHHLRDRGEPHVPELPEHAVQPHADDVSEPVPDQLLSDGRSGRLSHLQPVPVPLLLCRPTRGRPLSSAHVMFHAFEKHFVLSPNPDRQRPRALSPVRRGRVSPF